jgi:hypothetical protein
MQIFIKGISRQKGCNIQTINDIEETDSTRILYIILNNMFGLQQKDYYLHNSKILEFSNKKTLADYEIGKDSTLNIHFRIGNARPVKFI